MTRLYIQPSFVNSCEEHGLWSGGNDQYRGDRSVNLATFDKNGRARVEAFSDNAVEALKGKNKPKVSIADRILPQQKRYTTLTNQMQELVADYKAGLYTLEEYSLLLDVVTAKRDRCHELLMKARSVKPVRDDEHTEQVPSHTFSPKAATQPEFVQEKQGNSVKEAVHSAKTDLLYFISGITVMFTGFLYLTH